MKLTIDMLHMIMMTEWTINTVNETTSSFILDETNIRMFRQLTWKTHEDLGIFLEDKRTPEDSY